MFSIAQPHQGRGVYPLSAIPQPTNLWPEWPSTPHEEFTDFMSLRDRCVLCILDLDNLRISGERQLDASINYRELEERLYLITQRLYGLAVLTSPAGQDEHAQDLRNSNWRVLDIKREVVWTNNMREVKGNADWDICFEAGRLIQAHRFDVILVGSGDGDLVLGIARGVRRIAPASQVFTLSVRTTTSQRILRDRVPDLVAGNFFVERDLLLDRDERESRTRRTA